MAHYARQFYTPLFVHSGACNVLPVQLKPVQKPSLFSSRLFFAAIVALELRASRPHNFSSLSGSTRSLSNVSSNLSSLPKMTLESNWQYDSGSWIPTGSARTDGAVMRMACFYHLPWQLAATLLRT